MSAKHIVSQRPGATVMAPLSWRHRQAGAGALPAGVDYPFRGEVQVKPDGFRNVQHNMEMAGIKFAHPAE